MADDRARRILMIWEQGGGWGHVSRLAPVARSLRAMGHDVTFVARTPALLARLAPGLEVLPLPATLPPGPPDSPLETWADLLARIGWGSEADLQTALGAWLGLFDEQSPDVLVLDHAPTALLAAQARSIPVVALGTGFASPPDVSPWPAVAPDATTDNAADMNARAKRETVLLDIVNHVMTHHAASPLTHLAELFNARVKDRIVTSWPELDHFGPRPEIQFAGTWSDTLGDRPGWPRGRGPRTFLYLKRFHALAPLLQLLGASGLPVLGHIDGIDTNDLPSPMPPSMRIVTDPVDMEWAAEQADLAVTHAGHGATAALLLGGVPLLLIPQSVEQYLLSRKVVALGAGQLASPKAPDQLAAGLQRLLTDLRYTQAAATFGKRHGRVPPARLAELAAERIVAAAN